MNLLKEYAIWAGSLIGDWFTPHKQSTFIRYLTAEEIMSQKRIKHIQEVVGTEPDGFWGEESIACCKSYLRGLMPRPSPWPNSDAASLLAFYGKPGDESQLVNCDVEGLGVMYEGKEVKTIRCHRYVAPSLRRIIVALSTSPFAYILKEFAGVYNNRPMRGGSKPSLHARGAAIDLKPGTNGNLTSWPAKADMPIEVMAFFAKEGWLPAGAFWGRDAMHFQATR